MGAGALSTTDPKLEDGLAKPLAAVAVRPQNQILSTFTKT